MPITTHKKIIAAISGLSILLTFTAAAPVRAGQEDVGRALAAIVGLAIVGAVIANKNDSKATAAHPSYKLTPRPLPRSVSRKLLPQRCLRTFAIDQGKMAGFGRKCLQRHYGQAQNLPQQCYAEVWTDKGRRGLYTARCMRHKGYQVARN